jgi:hypothetical protein
MRDTSFQPAQLGQAAHATQQRVARVGSLGEVVEHLMAMIRPHRKRPSGTALQQVQLQHDCGHASIAFQMGCLVKRAIRFALD